MALPAQALDNPAQAARLVAAGAPDLAMQLAHAALQKTPDDAAWRDVYWLATARTRRPADLKVAPPGGQAEAAAWAGYRLALARQYAAKADWPTARGQWAQALWQGGLDPAAMAEVRAAIAQSWLASSQADGKTELVNPILLRLLRDDPRQLPLVETAALRLLDLQQAQGALELLDALSAQSPLRLLAQLRLGVLTPEQAQASLRSQTTGPAAALAWQALLRLALERNDAGLRVEALEALLGMGIDSERHAFDLWQAYQDFAEQVANRRQLLIGMDAAWLDQARQALDEAPLEGRALLVWLARQGTESALRIQAIEILAENLTKQQPMPAPRLLGNAPIALPRLPESLRYRLGEQARTAGDYALSAAWWQGVSATEAAMPARSWYLAQAEVNARAARDGRALEWLGHALAPGEPLIADQAEAALGQLKQRLRQGQLDQVEHLARQLLTIAPAAEQRKARQLLGEVSELRGQWAEAAAQHLLSAAETADNQTLLARARAARNLERAGLFDDAARQSRLIEAAGSPATADAPRR
ncbi:MAG: hypothetical protein HXY26_01360 [Hydrogenophilaceae bacterium]|nr:hypothetical protein [Hydrogenophilaceae bacterium]